MTGRAVAPDTPRAKYGQYWGYTTRIAKGLTEVWTESPYKGGYDLSIGVSDKGEDAHASGFSVPSFSHAVIVFGGITTLGDAILADDSIPASTPDDLFSVHMNPCVNTGTAALRTEESILIAMSALKGHFQRSGR